MKKIITIVLALVLFSNNLVYAETRQQTTELTSAYGDFLELLGPNPSKRDIAKTTVILAALGSDNRKLDKLAFKLNKKDIEDRRAFRHILMRETDPVLAFNKLGCFEDQGLTGDQILDLIKLANHFVDSSKVAAKAIKKEIKISTGVVNLSLDPSKLNKKTQKIVDMFEAKNPDSAFTAMLVEQIENAENIEEKIAEETVAAEGETIEPAEVPEEESVEVEVESSNDESGVVSAPVEEDTVTESSEEEIIEESSTVQDVQPEQEEVAQSDTEDSSSNDTQESSDSDSNDVDNTVFVDDYAPELGESPDPSYDGPFSNEPDETVYTTGHCDPDDGRYDFYENNCHNYANRDLENDEDEKETGIIWCGPEALTSVNEESYHTFTYQFNDDGGIDFFNYGESCTIDDTLPQDVYSQTCDNNHCIKQFCGSQCDTGGIQVLPPGVDVPVMPEPESCSETASNLLSCFSCCQGLHIDWSGSSNDWIDYRSQCQNSCIDSFRRIGCTDSMAENFLADANSDDGLCAYQSGCTNTTASNYDPSAYTDDGSCAFFTGCMDPMALNFNALAVESDSSCQYLAGCTNPMAFNYDPSAYVDDGSCKYVTGCMDPIASNYNPFAVESDSSCEYSMGCTDLMAINFEPTAYFDDGSCNYDTSI